MASNKTVIVTGASQGIGAAVAQAFLGRGYNVVATSRSVSKAGFAPSPNLAFAVDGRPDLQMVVYNPATSVDAEQIRSLIEKTPAIAAEICA